MRAVRLASALMATLAAAGLAGGSLTPAPSPRSPGRRSPRARQAEGAQPARFRKIGVLLPDTTTSPRYTEFDAP